MDPSLDPSIRLRTLADYASSTLNVKKDIPIHRYYRSGREMLRNADYYHKDGDIQSAYLLYIKYLTLFIEKIIEHPEYPSFPQKEKILSKAQIKEIFPKSELLKKQLLLIYQKEHDEFQKQEEMRRREEQLRIEKEKEALKLKQSEEERRKLYNETRNMLVENSLIPPHRPEQEPQLSPNQSINNSPDRLYPLPEAPPMPDAPSAAAKGVPSFDRNLKPRSVFFSPTGLRKVVVPASLIDEFIALARYNTDKNVETCGLLAGSLVNNQFSVTHLLIPKQRGNSDSCTTENEEEVFDVQDKHQLVTLGWIHTHPSQTAFLSSVDLHTHYSYQLMMPEAIAIVCAPKYNETGYFTLTPSHGLEVIGSCHQKGFHPHPSNPPLFEVASHVEIHPSAPVSVIDLRRP